ncbi:hypothetical protein K438DRAFT_1933428 [Mycena galopus ATCC 62051]|nr:hypothetical protein K438DRAFT_1933428 [Mycena galopus ATCC 62051]
MNIYLQVLDPGQLHHGQQLSVGQACYRYHMLLATKNENTGYRPCQAPDGEYGNREFAQKPLEPSDGFFWRGCWISETGTETQAKYIGLQWNPVEARARRDGSDEQKGVKAEEVRQRGPETNVRS